jgi:probable phosphoglycerate mutase
MRAANPARHLLNKHPMRRVVYLARHGETDWNRHGRWQGHTDIPLNAEGRAQADRLAEAIRAHGITHVGSSDLARARETAEIVAGRIPANLLPPHPGLRERAFGVFEGLTRDECAARYPDVWARYRKDPRACPPGAEPPDAVVARVSAALAAIAEELDETPAMLVTHGGVIRAFVSHATGAPIGPVPNVGAYRLVLEGGAIAGVEPV